MDTLRTVCETLIDEGWGGVLWSDGADRWDAYGILDALAADPAAFEVDGGPRYRGWAILVDAAARPQAIDAYTGAGWVRVFDRAHDREAR